MAEALLATRSMAASLPFVVADKPRDIFGFPHGPERRSIMNFALKDHVVLNEVLFEQPMAAVAYLGYSLQNVARKVSGEPYFKHVLRTVMLTGEAAVAAGLSLQDTRVAISTAYLHDALELQRRTNPAYTEFALAVDLLMSGVDAREIARIASLVCVLTPPKEGREVVGNEDYKAYKVGHFREKFRLEHADSRLLRIVKAADMTANMEETVDDIERGYDDSRMARPYSIRADIFRQCIAVVQDKDPANPLLPRLYHELAFIDLVLKNAAR